LQGQLGSDRDSPSVWDELRSVVHKLAGASGLYGFDDVSCSAAAREQSIVETRSGSRMPGRMQAELSAFVKGIEAA